MINSKLSNSMTAPEPKDIRKVVIQGDSGVGKSSLWRRISSDTFMDTGYTTIGVDFVRKEVQAKNGSLMVLQMWGNGFGKVNIADTAGRERFRTITQSYFRGASAVVIAVSLTDKNSFKNLPLWYQEIQRGCPPEVAVFIVGTKSDLKDKREVSSKEIQELADSWNASYIETSAKSGYNCPEFVEALTEKLSKLPPLNANKTQISSETVKTEPTSFWTKFLSYLSWATPTKSP